MLLLVLPVDTMLARASITTFDDQTLMERIIDQCDDYCRLGFTDGDSFFLPVCSWPGITCDGNGEVVKIHWDDIITSDNTVFLDMLPQNLQTLKLDDNDATFYIPSESLPYGLKSINAFGTIFEDDIFDFHNLPSSLGTLHASLCSLKGSISVKFLPAALKSFQVASNHLSDTIDFEALPKGLEFLNLACCQFSGELNLHSLPSNLKELNVSNNIFSGEISLCFLPDNLEVLNVARNNLKGELHFKNLPRGLRSLSLERNAFQGTLDIGNLPACMKALNIGWNALTGKISARDLPRGMADLTLDESGILEVTHMEDLPRGLSYLFRHL